MQAKRDKVNTTVGWSIIGNFAGIGAVKYVEDSDKWKAYRYLHKREFLKVGVFLGCVGAFTLYGYGKARQEFVRTKLKIVEEHSLSFSE